MMGGLRGPLWRGKKLIGKEALFVIQGLKRFKDDEEKLNKFIKTHVLRLLKMDMIVVLAELERQEEVSLATKLLQKLQIWNWRCLWPRGLSALVAQLTQQQFISPSHFDPYAYGAMIRDFIQASDFTAGKAIHCQILKKDNCLYLFAHNILLDFYVKSDDISDASNLFDEIPTRNTISFVILIQGYAQSFQLVEAVNLFSRLHREGHELNPFVFTAILKLLVGLEWAELAQCIHACIYKLGYYSNAFVGTALLDAYSVCGYVDCAIQVFDAITYKDMVCWTGIVAACAENDHFEDSLQLF